ncbi:uroporphyrinogen decarboxylase [Nostoc punctiforme FACHB-252]|jgi:uroporphyrinogen decarboxylase|uniref:Uroporphyrinogen decarboxylase n=1 Tax=Nostoc punctiforme FACHB-252 TaxID=1357509 RepID=A0ABR8HEA5_NOSPU|nr:uroporphyrinogen decarboxylase [Nostoc punctiforme]MBD2613572.1 uroporphyrinogen decarboxylase [Nostoc punctiforme FACHB-252]
MGNYTLLQAARGEVLDRPPVWVMRQAGRYMKVYRDLRQKYPSFRDRSENPDLAVEISLQPFRAFQPDGVIMFSDILTPLPGMGISFDIIESKGPVFDRPIRSQAQIDALTALDPEASLPFVRQILTTLRQEVNTQATVLGFVGAPWTLAAYAIEGKSSKDYAIIKKMAFCQPAMLHQFLGKLADAIAVYARYQINAGAQVIQLFDSWAGQLSPEDFQTLSLPYLQRVVQQVKATHPDTPLILYIHNSAGILELMAQSGVDIVSVDWTVDMAVARQRLGPNIGVQGNIDPCVLFGPQELIRQRILDTIRKAGNQKHILNLGHGILQNTPEENVAFFFETVKQLSYSSI